MVRVAKKSSLRRHKAGTRPTVAGMLVALLSVAVQSRSRRDKTDGDEEVMGNDNPHKCRG